MNIIFDSLKLSSGYEEISDWIKPAFIDHLIQVKYSKEFEFLKEVRGYKKGWDSYGGKVADKNSIRSSINFLSSLTKELKASNTLAAFPEFCLAPDGILGFEWDYAKGANLFARIYSQEKIKYSLTEKNNKQSFQETNSANFIEICKKKLQFNQAA